RRCSAPRFGARRDRAESRWDVERLRRGRTTGTGGIAVPFHGFVQGPNVRAYTRRVNEEDEFMGSDPIEKWGLTPFDQLTTFPQLSPIPTPPCSPPDSPAIHCARW